MTPRELAAAIRKGAAITPWHRGGLYYCEGATCVFGAAAVGLGAASEDEINELAGDLHKEAPQEGLREKYGMGIIDINDKGLMTREQVADWLDSLDMEKPKDRQTFENFMATTLKSVDVEIEHAKHP